MSASGRFASQKTYFVCAGSEVRERTERPSYQYYQERAAGSPLGELCGNGRIISGRIKWKGKGGLYADIRSILEQARGNAIRAVNFSMVIAYYEVGKRIVEEDQQGNDRANYGEYSLKELSKKLTADFGKGFTAVSLDNFRRFYLVFSDKEKSSAVRRKLDEPKSSAVRRISGDEKSSAMPTIFDRSKFAVPAGSRMSDPAARVCEKRFHRCKIV